MRLSRHISAVETSRPATVPTARQALPLYGARPRHSRVRPRHGPASCLSLRQFRPPRSTHGRDGAGPPTPGGQSGTPTLWPPPTGGGRRRSSLPRGLTGSASCRWSVQDVPTRGISHISRCGETIAGGRTRTSRSSLSERLRPGQGPRQAAQDPVLWRSRNGVRPLLIGRRTGSSAGRAIDRSWCRNRSATVASPASAPATSAHIRSSLMLPEVATTGRSGWPSSRWRGREPGRNSPTLALPGCNRWRQYIGPAGRDQGNRPRRITQPVFSTGTDLSQGLNLRQPIRIGLPVDLRKRLVGASLARPDPGCGRLAGYTRRAMMPPAIRTAQPASAPVHPELPRHQRHGTKFRGRSPGERWVQRDGGGR